MAGVLFVGGFCDQAARRLHRLPERLQASTGVLRRRVAPRWSDSPDCCGAATQRRQGRRSGTGCGSCVPRLAEFEARCQGATAPVSARSRPGRTQAVESSIRTRGHSTTAIRQNPREKGVDVQLAVDFVLGMQKGDFDIGVIFSEDTDLHPALEAVGELQGPGRCELAMWRDPMKSGPRQVLSGGVIVPTHMLTMTDYWRMSDDQDYNQQAARKPRPPRNWG
jgi:hypothetical protein